MKRREFILGAAFGLILAAGATAGGVIQWPGAVAQTAAGERLIPSAGRPGLAFAPPQGAPLSFADIFDQVSPAVVQIDVKSRIPTRRSTVRIPGLPFEFEAPDTEEPGDEAPDEGQTALGAGSGFFISADGFIVTNNHVVANAEEITVRLSDGRELNARLVGRDEDTDLAVIKVEGGRFPYVAFEEGVEPRVGDWVIAVGNPFGLGGTATSGIVSARGRDIDSAYVDYIQIDAAINRGNSGGPTFDVYGRVIGVNSAIVSPTGGSVGIGFAIPASVAKPITDRLMSGRTVERGYLGVEIGDLDRFREALGLPDGSEGALINSVTSGGPAERGGLKAGDIVVALNGRPVGSSTDLTRRVGEARAGDSLRLDILRDGRRQSVVIRSGTRPSRSELEARNVTPRSGPIAPPDLTLPASRVAGLAVTPVTDELRRTFRIPADVSGLMVVGVAAGGDERFKPGFVITRAGLGPARSVSDFEGAVDTARRAGRDVVFVLVWTPEGNAPVVLDIPKPK